MPVSTRRRNVQAPKKDNPAPKKAEAKKSESKTK